MKYYELDKEEQEILDSVERGEWKPVKNLAVEKRRLRQIARHTLNKTKNINIRLSERDVQKLKARAIKEGLHYQTFASSVLHKVVSE